MLQFQRRGKNINKCSVPVVNGAAKTICCESRARRRGIRKEEREREKLDRVVLPSNDDDVPLHHGAHIVDTESHDDLISIF